MDRLDRFTPRTFAAEGGTVQVSVTLDGTVKLAIRQADGRVAKVTMPPERGMEIHAGLRAKCQAAAKEVAVK